MVDAALVTNNLATQQQGVWKLKNRHNTFQVCLLLHLGPGKQLMLFFRVSCLVDPTITVGTTV